jgi:undecaprenyl-diphosphatase
LLTLAEARMPYLPGDLALARGIQTLGAISNTLAQWITKTAETPWCIILLGLALLSAWAISGWRAALLASVFFGLWLFGIWLSPLIARPRPSPDLIGVVGRPRGFAFPSIFGLIYASTFGYIALLALARSRGTAAILISVACALILLVGASARIVLGAHWPSDLWVAYLIGAFWVELVLPLSRGDAIVTRS